MSLELRASIERPHGECCRTSRSRATMAGRTWMSSRSERRESDLDWMAAFCVCLPESRRGKCAEDSLNPPGVTDEARRLFEPPRAMAGCREPVPSVQAVAVHHSNRCFRVGREVTARREIGVWRCWGRYCRQPSRPTRRRGERSAECKREQVASGGHVCRSAFLKPSRKVVVRR